ncbi:BPI fold-containing family C protein-like [Rhinatrema bivittatum]|uniref:BPI fold-containing family C protein-like n=1 Tax=Rhinatrema bivittatum TaxID=194408 RepID=UPI0011284CC6|nr:BPI fold-containing family C protein-like [Rhinatrema bivittatum]
MGKLYSFILLLTWLTLSVAVNPGLKLRVTQKGLDCANDVGKIFLQNYVKSLPIPNISGEENVRGKLSYDITDIQIEDLTINESSLTVVPDAGIQMFIKNSKATINSNCKVDHWMLKAREKLVVELSGVSIKANFKISQNDAGIPTFSLDSCQSDIKNVEVKLHKAMEVVAKMFNDKLEDYIRKTLNERLCPALTEESKKWDAKLSSYHFRSKVDDFVELDYHLVTSPVFTEKYIDVDIKGTFYAIKNHKEPTFAPVPFSLPDQSDAMLYTGVSASVVNSAAEAYYTSGVLSHTLTDNEISELTKAVLGISEKPSEPLPVTVKIAASKPPTVTLRPNNMTVEVAGLIELSTKGSNSPSQSMISASMAASISADLGIAEANSMLRVSGSLTLNSFAVQITSKDKDSKFSDMEKALQDFIQEKGVPFVNEKLKSGLIFQNSEYFPLVNPVFHTYQDFMLLSSDIACSNPRS